MRAALARLVLGLAALWVATAAHALPASELAALSGPVVPPAAVQIDVAKGLYAEKGINYGSFRAMPGASYSGPAGYAQTSAGSLVYFPTRTNYLIQSQAWASSPWNVSKLSSATNNAATAPDGTLTATALYQNSVSTDQIAYQTVTVPSGTQFEFSYLAKSGNYDYAKAMLVNGAPGSGTACAGAIFRFSTQTLTPVTCGSGWSNGVQSFTSLGGGWYKINLAFTAPAGTTAITPWVGPSNTTATTTGSSSNFIYVADGQLEAQSTPAPAGGYPTAYIATTSAAVSVNDPRITDLGLLVEQSSTNLNLQSNALATSPWTSGGAGGTTATNGATTAPDGTNTASHISDTTTTGTHGRNQLTSQTTGTFTHSAYLHAAEYSRAVLDMSDTSTGDAVIGFNLATCATYAPSGFVAGSWTAISYTCTQLANGWDRVTITGTKNAGASLSAAIYLDNGTTTSFAGTGSSGVYAWCDQLEAGSSATSCTPTTTAAATRAADVAYLALPTTLLPTTGYTLLERHVFGQSNGTTRIFAEGGLTSVSGASLSTDAGGTQERAISRMGVLGDTSGIGGAQSATAVERLAVSGGNGQFAAALNGRSYPSQFTPALAPWVGGITIGGRTGQSGGTSFGNTYIQALELDDYATPASKLPARTLH